MQMERSSRKLLCAGAVLAISMFFCRAGAAHEGQAKATLVSGILYRVHTGFLEVKSDEKHVSVVKVDSETVYWNGKTDKVATKKDLSLGDELIAEMIEKNGALVAQKVRFLNRGS
ncbi:MAG TPA: hypothetical protein VN025_20100 [Candidatus Dormibacteraeota bacterium]|nr:hypothetical protein [Candidatus Dormibacteraeota bacterium]